MHRHCWEYWVHPSQFRTYLSETICTDMQNVLGVFMEYLALIEIHPTNTQLVNGFKNRMILQLNFSNTIHLGLQESAKQMRSEDYMKIKETERNKFGVVIEIIGKKFQNYRNLKAFEMLQDYQKKNFANETQFKQYQLEKCELKQEKAVQELISTMQSSNLQQQISNGNISEQNLYNIAESRYNQAKEKIKNSGIQQIQPENYPYEVKQILGTYYFVLSAPPQYKDQLEKDFQQQILELMKQKSDLTKTCLLNFSGKLNNNLIKDQIYLFANLTSEQLKLKKFKFDIPLDANDQKQFAQFSQFTLTSQSVVQDYFKKQNIVEAVQQILFYALNIINPQKEKSGCLNPLSVIFDLNLKDQIGTQFLKLQDKFKSSFMKKFCQDIANQKVLDYQYRFEKEFEEDILLLKKLTN